MERKIRNLKDVKVNIRPVTVALVHDYVFEGPCRFGKGDELTSEWDAARGAQIAANHMAQINEAFGDKSFINVMNPITITRNETFPITEDIIAEFAQDVDDVDLYIVTYFPFGIDLVLEFAKRYKKPFGTLLPGSATGTCTVATLRASGLTCFGWASYDDALDDILALRAQKTLANMRILALTRANSTVSVSAPDSFFDHGTVKDKLGVGFTYMNLHEFVDQTHCVDPSTNPTLPGRVESNIDAKDMEEIEAITKDLVANAAEITMPVENVAKSVKAHVLTQKLLEALDCNAFTAPCPDMCATRRLNEEQFTMCLNHSLNNEKGICSACEYDISALVSMALLSSLSRTAPYMGNTMVVKFKADSAISAPHSLTNREESFEIVKESVEGKGGIVCTYHSTPNRKLHGFKSDESPYALHPFAMDGRWGATIRYDFNADKGQTVTVARFDPTCSKLFVARGTVVSGAGYTEENCSEGIFYSVNDVERFAEGNMTTGNHLALVIGDVYDAATKFGALAGLEVIGCK